jgi:peptidoglycan/LPS O-acetylase OafA/YrhL
MTGNTSARADAPRTRGIGEVRALSGLRGFAALWVMAYHWWALGGTPRVAFTLAGTEVNLVLPLSLGWAGVDIFFVLSAFLLALPFAEAREGLTGPVPLAGYFRKRALRILPAYYVQLAVLLALALLFGIGRTLGPGEFLAHLVVLFHVTRPPVAPLVGVWYTLTPECMYYLVLPLAAVWFRPRRWLVLILLALATMLAWRWHVATVYGHLPVPERVNLLAQLPARIDQFMIGSLMAYAAVRARFAPDPVRGDALALAAIAAVVALALWLQASAEAYWQGAPVQFVWHGLFAAAVGAFCHAAVRGSRVAAALFGNRVLGFFGRVSFSLYLWHFPIFQWVESAAWVRALPLDPPVRLALVGVPIAIAAAWLSYRLVERPFLRLAHRSVRTTA